MFQPHSKLSRKILKRFLVTYTVIFCVLSVLILTGASLFFLYNTGQGISAKISLITDIWDEYEDARQGQVYTLLSSQELTGRLRDYYLDPSVKNRERVNIYLANFQTSDAGIQYLFMEDDEGNIFHSLNSSVSEIQEILRGTYGYEKTKETGGAYISPIQEGTSENLPELYSCYTNSQVIYGHMFTICCCCDAKGLERNIKNAGTELDFIQIYNAYGDVLYRSSELESGSVPVVQENKNELFGCIFTRNGIAGINGSYTTLSSTMGMISYGSLLKDFLPLFAGLLGIYFIPIILALLYIIPSNDKMLEPIGKLSTQVQGFSLGMQPEQGYDSDDEIGELSRSFYEMAVNINRQSEELSEKEREKAVTYYKLLTTQTDPHFIYNTMNIVNILAREGAYEDIIKVNTALTKVLRERLNTQNTVFEEVGKEIENLKQYQLIMDYRYHNQVSIEYSIDDDVLEKKIPKNILQPLVENAYYHGLAADTGEIRGNITILIYALEEELVLEISDDGKGFSEQRLKEIRENFLYETLHREKEAHIGLENIYRRISYLYGEHFSMEIRSEEGHGAAVILSLPLDSDS